MTEVRDWQSLSGLPLRRAVCELLGWRFVRLPNGYYSLQKPDGTRPLHWNSFHDWQDLEAWQNAPLLELSADAVLPLLIAECGKGGFVVHWRTMRNGKRGHFVEIIGGSSPSASNLALLFEVNGSTPTEALCRALGMLLAGSGK